MDPGQFTTVAKNSSTRIDAAGALAEANHAYQRRYFHIAEPVDGLVRLRRAPMPRARRTLRTALQPFMKPVKDDDRSYGQRQRRRAGRTGRQGSGGSATARRPRAELIIRASSTPGRDEAPRR